MRILFCVRVSRWPLLVGFFTASFAFVGSPAADASDKVSGAHVFRGPGIELPYPSGLYVSNRPLDWTTDPAQRFVLSTYRVPVGRPNASGGYTPPPTGVIAQLLEDVPPPDPGFRAPVRPRHFTLPKLTDHLEGFGDRWAEIPFREHGRDFYIFLAVGPRASQARIALVLGTLDALVVGVAPPAVTGA